MKKIVMRKTAKYDPLIPGFSRYGSYDLITRQKYQPGIVREDKMAEGIYDGIFASDMRRGVETAGLYHSAKPALLLPDLREVKFSLKDLLTEEEYDSGGSNLVRQRFAERFMDDRLSENRRSIRERILALLKRLTRLQGGTYLGISHSFFMKILDIYVKDGDLFKHPTLLAKYFNTQKKTYNFQEGFEFEL